MTNPSFVYRYPYLPLVIRVAGNSRDLEVSAEVLIDTGFEGDIVLPISFLEQLGPSDTSTEWLLADGSRVSAASFLGEVEMPQFGIRHPAIINVIGNEFLVGRVFLENYRIIHDHGREVVVEP